MKKHLRRAALAAALAGLLLGGCVESKRTDVTGKGSVLGVNAIANAPDVAFRIEERLIGNVSYKGASTRERFDDLTYVFNFDTRLPGETDDTRLASREVAVVPDTAYFFALTGTLDDSEIVLWEQAERDWDGSESVAEVFAGHLAPSVGAVDVYLLPTGTTPSNGGQPAGTLTFGERLPAFDVDAGSYRVYLTAPSTPSPALFRSEAQTLAERTSVLFTIHDADPSISSDISVRRISESGGSTEVGDLNSPPTRRFLHAASGTGNVDVYVGDDFAAPIAADLGFGELSADAGVPEGSAAYTYTAAGNTGAILLEETRSIDANSRNTSFLLGEPGDLSVVSFKDDRRPVAGTGKFRLVQASSSIESVDVYIQQAGSETPIADANPSFRGVETGRTTGYLAFEPGNYDVTVTEEGEKTVVAGALQVDLTAEGNVEVAVVDTTDPSQLELIVYDP